MSNKEFICEGCCTPVTGNFHRTYEFNGAQFCCRTCYEGNYVPEEIRVADLIEDERIMWEKMEPGIETCYTFEGHLGLALLRSRREVFRLKKLVTGE